MKCHTVDEKVIIKKEKENKNTANSVESILLLFPLENKKYTSYIFFIQKLYLVLLTGQIHNWCCQI